MQAEALCVLSGASACRGDHSVMLKPAPNATARVRFFARHDTPTLAFGWGAIDLFGSFAQMPEVAFQG